MFLTILSFKFSKVYNIPNVCVQVANDDDASLVSSNSSDTLSFLRDILQMIADDKYPHESMRGHPTLFHILLVLFL